MRRIILRLYLSSKIKLRVIAIILQTIITKRLFLMRKTVFLSLIPLLLSAHSLDELVELSYHNRLVESSKYKEGSKELSYESTKSSYLPTLDLGVSYQNASKESAAMARDTLRGSATLKYIIYDGGKKSHLYDMLQKGVSASKEDTRSLKNELALEISRLYYGYLSTQADKRANAQLIKQLEAEHARLSGFYEVGSITKDELDKIDSRLKNAILNSHEFDLELERSLSALEYLTMQEGIGIDDGSVVKSFDDEAVLRADVESLKLQSEALKYSAASVRSANYPTLFFDDTFSHTKYYFDDESKKSNFLIKTQNIASLNASWNILDFGSISKEYESKQFEYLAQNSLFEYEKHKAEVDLRLAKRSLEIAKQKVDASKATLDAATSTYDLIKVRYEGGVVDNVAYLQALSEQTDAKRAYERALYDVELKKAELVYHSGKDIKEYL